MLSFPTCCFERELSFWPQAVLVFKGDVDPESVCILFLFVREAFEAVFTPDVDVMGLDCRPLVASCVYLFSLNTMNNSTVVSKTQRNPHRCVTFKTVRFARDQAWPEPPI